jgi:predicted  nucleic acid-binding Zn-ribbon protein
LRDEVARLKDLQVLDRRLQELEQSLNEVAGRVEQLREENLKSETELKKLAEQEQQNIASRKRIEKDLAEGEARIRNKRMRLNLVRTDKELQALTHEVDSLREHNQQLESELLTLMEPGDTRANRIKELGELVAKGRAELAAAEKEIAGQVEELKTAIAAQRAEREELAQRIDSSLRARYDMIFARRQGIAVAEVKPVNKDGKCSGCQRLLPPQMYNEILRKEDYQIHFCPSCQRILFYED